ncbi:MAG: lipoyl synthase [Deltaproteobacteria bacterium]|nr:lipoyl synthase [Deltaproteobacteria bacterium]
MSGALPRERPPWLKVRAPSGKGVSRVEEVLRKNGLVTVCREARCPNVGECWGEGTATVLILGDLCSRACAFCSVASGQPSPPDSTEPARLAAAAAELAWRHLVVTSVTRDDLPDGGAAQFAQVVKELRQLPRPPSVELLVPDFAGDRDALAKVVRARPDILAHNVETVPRLYSRVRPRASYERSLALLSRAHATAPGLALKSGLMVGFGETEEEVVGVMEDLYATGCRSITVGQYLSPSRRHLPVTEYLPVEAFEELASAARRIGFLRVASGPFVRSSYRAGS